MGLSRKRNMENVEVIIKVVFELARRLVLSVLIIRADLNYLSAFISDYLSYLVVISTAYLNYHYLCLFC